MAEQDTKRIEPTESADHASRHLQDAKDTVAKLVDSVEKAAGHVDNAVASLAGKAKQDTGVVLDSTKQEASIVLESPKQAPPKQDASIVLEAPKQPTRVTPAPAPKAPVTVKSVGSKLVEWLIIGAIAAVATVVAYVKLHG